ncbi:MAG: glutamyl-tRNA reductase, partial [Fibrobacter sp.]|nr:glutamyl-tRNA reductase [Fibrobacter sp.]
MMHIGALATDFHSSSIRMRDMLYLEKDRLVKFVKSIQPEAPLGEIVILCTCNRIELYYVCDDHNVAAEWLTEYLAAFHRVSVSHLKNTLVNHRCAGAVRHLFRVASGVESMVFGEHEILGQIRDAYFFCREQDSTDSYLNRLFQQAIATGKLVRNKTGAGRGSLSVPSIAVELLLEKSGGTLEFTNVMVVGTGTMGLRTIKRISLKKTAALGICNRTGERAVKLCERFNATHIPFTDLKTKIKDYNAIILATSSQEYILSADDVLFNCETRKKNLLVIDLGVPRNADPSIGAIDGVTLACIDDLKTTADRHLQERENEIGEIECIIEEQ